MTQGESGGMELRDYFSVMRRRRWVIFLAVFVVAATALLMSSLQTPVYEAEARVLLEPSVSLFDETSTPIGPAAVRTEIEVLTSAGVAQLVRERIGAAPKVKAQQLGDTQVMVVRAESTDATRAAEVANAYSQGYIDFRRKQAIDNLSAAGQAIQARIAELDRQIAEFDANNPPPTNLPPGVQPPRSPEREGLESQRFFFRQKAEQLNVDTQLKNGGSQLVAPAVAPTDPIRPQPVRNVLLGVLAGLILGTGTAFLLEHLDDSIKAKEDIERVTRDVAVVGVIPYVTGWRNRHETRVMAKAEPSSPAAEAYRTLRTSIDFLGLDRSLRTLQITSPSAGEGKTTTTVNLAVTLAQAGRRVILVSCDLRRPRVHEFFGLSNAVGFTSLLFQDAPVSSVLQRVPGVERLLLVASGPLPPNPSELLASSRTTLILDNLKANSDIVLLDSTPVLPVTDAAVLSRKVDATLLIATAGVTSKKALARAYELLRQVQAPIIGTVLNGASSEGAYGYTYAYTYETLDAPQNGKRGAKKQARTPTNP